MHNYQEVLSDREIDLINYMARPYLGLFGYEPTRRTSVIEFASAVLTPEKQEMANCATFRSKILGVMGMLYRRISAISKH